MFLDKNKYGNSAAVGFEVKKLNGEQRWGRELDS